MGLFGSSTKTKAEEKERIRNQYDSMIANCQSQIDSIKKAIENGRWQLKMTKDKAWKNYIDDQKYRLKPYQEQLKRLKADKAAALKRV